MLSVSPQTPPPLDKGYVAPILVNRRYRQAVKEAAQTARLALAIEREDGRVCRGDVDIIAPGSAHDADTFQFLDRHIKFLIWSRGGWKIHIAGPDAVCRYIQEAYSPAGSRAVDVDLMRRAYERPFVVECVDVQAIPAEKEEPLALGGHWDGCRIGFDLGASDYKIAAVIDGRPVYSDELPWNPKKESDPRYHYGHIRSGLERAAQHLPKVQAIGGSSAGVLVNNRFMLASLFRSVPADRFEKDVKPMFLRMQKEWNVPFDVINDGEVTALAGALSLRAHAVLGMAMGSSEAGGYVDRQGHFLGWLDELAFAPVDFNPAAVRDDWSGDSGVGAQYFSQQAVNKLLAAAGLDLPEEMGIPERLKAVQTLAENGAANALAIFETIGVYLGYTIPHYAEYYDFEHLLVLGRVMSGIGGDTIQERATRILKSEFPELAERVTLHVPDEKSRRVGQAVAAASLPAIQ